MRFLRRRGDKVEHVWSSDFHTATEKARALNVLSGAVILVRHPYDADPHSGSGNWWCGRARSGRLHLVVEAS